MRKPWFPFAVLAMLASFAATGSAAGKMDIGSDDVVVIQKSGNYTLRRHLTAQTEAPLITVAADDVVIDLNGFSLTGLGAKLGVGIAVNDRTNVKVVNGHLRNFGTAVRVEDSSNVDLSGLQITGEDIPGGPPETGILLLNSRAAHIHGNVINRTFLGIFVRGGGSGANTIKGNTIAGGENGQLGICYNPAPGADGATDGPAGDLVAENHISRFRTGIQMSPASRSNIFVRNYLNFFVLGFDERTPGSNTLANNVTTPLL